MKQYLELLVLVLLLFALAFFAVGFDDIGTTTVAFIELTATVVVLIVTDTIADIPWRCALVLTGFFVIVWVFRILALAFFAVGCFDMSTLD
jgi:energy-coupling factor transporter transmembrane protein EcfT